jgi:hypothetical protein
VIASVCWKLPYGVSKEEAINKVTEALDELPGWSTQRDMEAAGDEFVSEYRAEYDAKAKAAAKKAERTKQKAHLVAAGLQAIYPHAQRLLRQFDYDQTESALQVEMRVKPEIREILEQGLTGNEDEQEVVRWVYQLMKQIEGCR